MFERMLICVIAYLIFLLLVSVVAIARRQRAPRIDVMRQAVGDAPHLPRVIRRHAPTVAGRAR